MKSKKRQQDSSEDISDDLSDKSSSSSDSESEASSESDHRNKKRRKRDESLGSESDVDKRSKKRKNKKKKKKHGKKKRRSESVESIFDNTSISEGEISPKKKRKHKHKHSKRNRKDSASEDNLEERRLQSVVKERRGSSEEIEIPTHTYYQKEYRRPVTGEYEREKEVQRFYRGSSKEHRQYPEVIDYERNERHADKYERIKEKRDPRGHFLPEEYERQRRQREYEEYKRQQRYEERRSPEVETYRKPREEVYPREHDRGYVRTDRHEDRRRREVDDERDYRERRQPPEPDRYRVREYADRREKYHDDRERYPEDRGRDSRRERPPPPPRVENPVPSRRREISRSRSAEDRYRDKRRVDRVEREERYREVRDDRREERRDRPIKDEADGNHSSKDDHRSKERKTRFTDGDDKKEYSWGKTDENKDGEKPAADKEKPNFGLSGKLTADANTVNGVVIKYTEPDDAKQPKRRWRFYPFKGDKALPILYIHRQSAFLIGRDKKVVDIALEHPSISKQHSALQYRATPFTRADGSQGRRVRPYIIDLESANGTFVNNKKIDPRRYVELLERDVVKFGFSQREYVLLHENSKDDAQDDDHHDPVEIGAAVTTTEQIKKEKRAKEEVKEDGD